MTLRSFAFLPPVDIAVSESDMVLTMDLPGFTSGDVSIEVLDDTLTVRGERPRPEPAEGAAFVRTERAHGRFERSIRLPRGVDPEAVTASLEHGVLSLIVPKPERLKPRAIEISAGDDRRALTA